MVYSSLFSKFRVEARVDTCQPGQAQLRMLCFLVCISLNHDLTIYQFFGLWYYKQNIILIETVIAQTVFVQSKHSFYDRQK